VSHARDADELLEVLGHELRPVVADHPGTLVGKLLPCPLDDDLHVLLGHLFADFPVDHESAIAVENAAQVVKGAADVQVGDVDVPMAVSTARLMEAFAFSFVRWEGSPQPIGPLQHPVDARRADGHHVVVQHHERQSAVAFQRIVSLVIEDRLLLPVFQPMVAWQ
jgi:hypothetical protein